MADSRPAGAAASALPRLSLAPPRVKLPLPRHPRRIALAALAVSGALAGGYLGWFRDSSLARVRTVEITGLSTAKAGRLRAELTSAARRMTTLDVDAGALWRAVGGDPLVHSIAADGDFPHTLRIDVTLNLPRAIVSYGGEEVPVAAGGTLLRGLATGVLPTISVSRRPRGTRITDPQSLSLVAVAAAAPAPLRAELESVSVAAGEGIVAHLRGGPLLIFGDAGQAAGKWSAAAAVLADASSVGATYVDVRDAQYPVAGGGSFTNTPQPDPGAATPETPAPGAPVEAPAAPAPMAPTSPQP